MILRNTVFCDHNRCTERRVGQSSTGGYFCAFSQPWYDLFWLPHFVGFYNINWSYPPNQCIPVHVIHGQEGFIPIMQMPFTWFRRWSKNCIADWHSGLTSIVRLTHTSLLAFAGGFAPGLSLWSLCEYLILNISRFSRFFYHLSAILPSRGPLFPIAACFFSKKSLLPVLYTSSNVTAFSILVCSLSSCTQVCFCIS